MDAAENMRTLLEGSKNALPLHATKVQDPYSQRCLPQIHGASRDAIAYVYGAVSREINAVTDNPIVFPDEDEVISGGNFHGQPMALAFDFLKIAISELANVAERRTERLVNPAMSEGLPAFLVKDGGLNNGFMIVGAAHHFDQLVVYDLDYLLPRRQTRKNVLSHRLLLDFSDELFDNLEVDVRFEQRQLDLPHGVVDVRLRQYALAAQLLKGIL